MKFRTVVILSGKTTTGIQVPQEVIESLGSNKRPRVQVTINGYTYRSSVAPMGGGYMLPINADHRKGAGVAGGEEVDVEIELDTQPREVTLPPDLTEALDGEADAKRFFDGLSYTQRLSFATWVESAKKAETRQRRLDETVTMLREGRTRR
ncbi:YdeI/OmpD-associated family protein [Streptosporangium canum]|uniref:YdeI/OmpD-associated family protein n=1 Tax=Streptosporangium canum TaxID=324952 RepID=UPI0033BBFE4D